MAGNLDESNSAAAQALSKALENDFTAAELMTMDDDKLEEVFKAKTDRMMRPILTSITRQPFRRPETLERLAAILA